MQFYCINSDFKPDMFPTRLVIVPKNIISSDFNKLFNALPVVLSELIYEYTDFDSSVPQPDNIRKYLFHNGDDDCDPYDMWKNYDGLIWK